MYLIAGGLVLAGAVGTAVAGVDIKVAGIIAMAVGVVVSVVGVTGFVLQWARSAARHRGPVAKTSGAHTFATIADASRVTVGGVRGPLAL